jgi:hypothetical protein
MLNLSLPHGRTEAEDHHLPKFHVARSNHAEALEARKHRSERLRFVAR